MSREINELFDISVMRRRVHAINIANGWFEEPRTFGDDIALLHSEVSEMFEAFRKNEGDMAIAEEAADILIRLLDTVQRYDIALVGAFWKKCEKNEQRGYRHGGRKV